MLLFYLNVNLLFIGANRALFCYRPHGCTQCMFVCLYVCLCVYWTRITVPAELYSSHELTTPITTATLLLSLLSTGSDVCSVFICCVYWVTISSSWPETNQILSSFCLVVWFLCFVFTWYSFTDLPTFDIWEKGSNLEIVSYPSDFFSWKLQKVSCLIEFSRNYKTLTK